MIRLLLVHDDNLVRCALASLLAVHEDFGVTTVSWAELTGGPAQAAHGEAGLWLLDVACPGSAGLAEAVARRRTEGAESAGLIVLAPAGRPGLLHRAFEARAQGYVSKDAPPERLIEAIRRVADGGRYVDEGLAYDFLSASRMPLTPRELSVLSLAADGAPVPEIARSLWLAEGTVRNYLAAVIRKTGARNRVDAIRIARTGGWV
ncbi:DNA-binding response regulator [Streptomyces hoynatensis]|uniref:DNA-binding response regulator n=1 Tax=Streptomyces hoynatensis TaxID=1141874 RepID=A0A3A9Z5B1_9ACTN|nr:response regulator transcription factor [Streptomyces hoynatensis]RKN42467.1 DNA-binding response regulator [Streptomyces hoynatensis]